MTTFFLTTARTRSLGNQQADSAAARTWRTRRKSAARSLPGNDLGTQNVQIRMACAVVGPEPTAAQNGSARASNGSPRIR